MTTVVNVQEAKTHLSDLLVRAERGEDVVIARAGRPVARLAPVEAAPPRTFGALEITVPAAFYDELPPDELDGWG